MRGALATYGLGTIARATSRGAGARHSVAPSSGAPGDCIRRASSMRICTLRRITGPLRPRRLPPGRSDRSAGSEPGGRGSLTYAARHSVSRRDPWPSAAPRCSLTPGGQDRHVASRSGLTWAPVPSGALREALHSRGALAKVLVIREWQGGGAPGPLGPVPSRAWGVGRGPAWPGMRSLPTLTSSSASARDEPPAVDIPDGSHREPMLESAGE